MTQFFSSGPLISFFGDTWCHLAATLYAGRCLESRADCTNCLAIRDFGRAGRGQV